MQAAGPDLITGYSPNQTLSDDAGQALRPMGPALMTLTPHMTPERSPSRTLKIKEAVHLPREHGACFANLEAGRTGRGVGTAAPRQPPLGNPGAGVVCGPQADPEQVALTEGDPHLLPRCLVVCPWLFSPFLRKAQRLGALGLWLMLPRRIPFCQENPSAQPHRVPEDTLRPI